MRPDMLSLSRHTTKLLFCSALFIQPRYAKLLNSTAVRHMLGEPSHSKEPITPGTVAPVPVKLPGGAEILVDTKA